jgi:uncharacterized LabA/DUF88 family protein
MSTNLGRHGRYAVFVDVGYFATAGQWAVSGQWRPRNSFLMDASKAVSAILGEASRQLEGRELLRLYWYDAAPGRLPTAEQQAVAELDDVAVRLGDLSSRGVQKGVDSLIVLDMYDAALVGSISDCVLLAGDADLAEGVARSRARGIRALVWSFATEKSTTAPRLRAEADRHRYLDPSLFAGVFSVPEERQVPEKQPCAPTETTSRPSIATFPSGDLVIAGAKRAAAAFARHMARTTSHTQLAAVFASAPYVPTDVDARLIRHTARELNLDAADDVLPSEAVIAMREAFLAELESCTASKVNGGHHALVG